jgi:Zn finger protein HypA/HybF involved in hydrogenase expression
MHEWQITQSLIEEIINQSKLNGLKKINKVCLAIGKETDISSDSLGFCFRSLAEETMLSDVQLEIRENEGRGIIIEAIEGLK